MLFPDPQRRGEIKFKLAKSLSYKTRLSFVVAFLFMGLEHLRRCLRLVAAVWRTVLVQLAAAIG